MPLTEEMISWNWWNWTVQALLALFTFGTVLVALFGDKLRSRFWPPKLHLSLEQPEGVLTKLRIIAPEGTERIEDARWYHLRVSNDRRWSPGNQVEVLLTKLEEPDASGEGYHTTWSGEIPMQWSSHTSSTRNVGRPALVDLGTVVKGKWFQLTPLIVPTNMTQQYRGRCNLMATLQARGVEGDSNTVRVRLAWDGQWADGADEMKAHMVVRVVP